MEKVRATGSLGKLQVAPLPVALDMVALLAPPVPVKQHFKVRVLGDKRQILCGCLLGTLGSLRVLGFRTVKNDKPCSQKADHCGQTQDGDQDLIFQQGNGRRGGLLVLFSLGITLGSSFSFAHGCIPHSLDFIVQLQSRQIIFLHMCSRCPVASPGRSMGPKNLAAPVVAAFPRQP